MYSAASKTHCSGLLSTGRPKENAAEEDPKLHGVGQWKQNSKKQVALGAKSSELPKIELSGGTLLLPYVPRGIMGSK